MNFSWLFGNSTQAHHLLAAYVVVWIVQGGYFSWVFWQWLRLGKPRS
jgi:hypothetical protein